MGEFDTSHSCLNLLCQETEEACLYETETKDDDETVYLNYYDSGSVSGKEDDYIEEMIQRETEEGFKTQISFSEDTSKSWLECARLDAIEWIVNTRATFGFQLNTVYLTVTYFDRFLSKKPIDDGKLWAIRLLSVACLSIAAKMVECRAPSLSEFHTQDYQFENKVIQRMELLVLSTLEWKMNSITPFAYLHYFISKLYGESGPKGLISKALDLIMAIIKEIHSLVNHRPSVIAAAAALAASDGGLTRKAMEFKMDFISFWGSLENEHVLSCYKMMQKIEMRKSKTPKFVISSNYLSVDYALWNASAVSNGAGTKRKLTFNESDQNSLAKKICHP